MDPVRKILVGIDFSPRSNEALRQAHDRALAGGARLAVCHIVPNELRSNPLFPHISGIAALRVPTDLERVGEIVTAHVGEITGRTPAEFNLIIDDGTPHAALLVHAEEWMADLLIVGSHGMTSVNTLLGSVTNQVIRYAHCPVLIVRPSVVGGAILAGTDFSDPALPALRAAAEEAGRTGTDLTVVHSLDITWPAASYPAMAFGGAPINLSAEQVSELEEAAAERLRETFEKLDIRGQTRIVHGPAGTTLIELASLLEASLLVVGTVGRTGLRRVLLGSVAEKVAAGAPCSVLIVRLHPT